MEIQGGSGGGGYHRKKTGEIKTLGIRRGNLLYVVYVEVVWKEGQYHPPRSEFVGGAIK